MGLLCSPPFATTAADGKNVIAGTTVKRSNPARTAVLIAATLLDVEPLTVEMRSEGN
jgi:hypothetical protein